jgi:uncharacterized protein
MFEGLVESAMLAYQTGSWDEIFIARTFEWLMSFPFALLGFSWMILALFVLGLDFGRRRFFQRLEDHATAIRRWSLPLLVVGIGLNLLLVYFGERYDPLAPDLYYLAYNVCLVIAPPILSAAYVATLCLLWLRPAGRRLLHPMAPVGRMALTNYLMHSLVFTTVSYSYGFGLYGEISYLEGLGLTVLMFAVQIPLSAWWLRHYRFGPMEWLWRTLSYGRMQPMRR